MNLTGIIAISGKPGLYKVIAQGKNNIIVEALDTKKRVPAYASDRISALEDISIYTYDDDKPLKEIFTIIHTKEGGKATISHKEDPAKLRDYMLEILPNFDQERVYNSDIKKLFQWYNMLLSSGNLILEEVTEEKPTKKATKKEVKTEEGETKEAPAKKAPAKKAPAAKKTADKPASKTTAKASSAKKVAAPKTGSSRGK